MTLAAPPALQLADLFLDSNPYNAHTTASDALWAGCPVLTRPGRTFAARVAGSLNHHLGLGELNVADDAAFVGLATALGNDPARLRDLGSRLHGIRACSGLFDMAGFARATRGHGPGDGRAPPRGAAAGADRAAPGLTPGRRAPPAPTHPAGAHG